VRLVQERRRLKKRLFPTDYLTRILRLKEVVRHRQLVEVVLGHLRERLLEMMRGLVLDRFRSTNSATKLRETQRTGTA
jgi:hypothetical protein